MAMKPVVVAVAITGSVPRKKDNPAVPITPQEQIESTQEAYEAGATLVHIHVRNDDESPSSDPERFARVQEGVVKHCPGMIVQFSTGGRGRDPSADRKSTRLNSSHANISYAVFCLKKKNIQPVSSRHEDVSPVVECREAAERVRYRRELIADSPPGGGGAEREIGVGRADTQEARCG